MRLLPRLLLSLLALMPLALSAAPSAAPLQEGRDYALIANPGPFAPLAGRIEVVEVFGYTCPHCAHFEPQLAAWAKKLPADVRFTPVPAVFGGYWDAWARAYYAAEQVGVAQRSHAAVFRALHETGELPMQNPSPEQLSAFYKGQGADPARYSAALKSKAVDEKLRHARAFAVASGASGTPTIVVNGAYLVKGRSFEDQLRITDALIQQIRSKKAP